MITGWITNKGKVIECKPFNHFCVQDETLLNIWDERQEEVREIEEICNARMEAGEHPEWHVYEIAESDCTAQAYSDAYDLGYLRLSPWNYRGELPQLAVEGRPEYIENHKKVIKELAEKHECKIKPFPKNKNKFH